MFLNHCSEARKSAAVKIVHLTSVHLAEDTRVFLKECRSLADAGFDVTLVANANDDYIRDGVTVRSIKRPHSNRLRRMIQSSIQVYRIAKQERGDAYHFHDPELIPVGLLLKLSGRRVIYDIHEHVAKQIRTKHWIPGPLRSPLAAIYGALELISARIFDGVIVADPVQKMLYPSSEVCVVENFPIVDEYRPSTQPYAGRPARIAYVGGLTALRGIHEMEEAISLVNSKREAILALAGTFSPASLGSEVLAGDHVEYRGFLDRDGVYRLFEESRAGIVVLHPIPNYMTSQPVKLLEYMLAGLPVVVCDFPYYRQYVADNGAGIMVDPLDPKAIANAITWLLDHPDEAEAMGRRGREAVLSKYSWASQAEKLVAFYRTMIPE